MKILLILLFLLSCTTVSATDYYISSSGNDLNNGLSISTSWKTIAKVNSYTFLPGDNILFNRGDTFYGTITILKSGSAGSPIVIGAYGAGANPTISGFTNLASWTNLSGNIYYATLDVPRLNIVTLNGVVKGMGRFPNTGYLNYESHTNNTSITDKQLTGTTNWTGAEIGIRKFRWIIDRQVVTNHSNGTLTYNALADYGNNAYYNPVDGNGYFFQNHIGCLDDLGDWCYDAAAKRIYMYFGGSPAGYTIKAGSLDRNLSIKTKNNINFENVNFEGANIEGINLVGGSHINFTNCNIVSQGGYALYGDNSSYIGITDCTITDALNNGIFLNANNVTIDGVDITNTGIIQGAARSGDKSNLGLYVAGNDLIVKNCNITNVGYNGIDFSGSNVLVENNFVTNWCSVKDDGGGIYTYSGNITNTNGIIRNNIVVNTNGAWPGCEAYSYEAFGKSHGIYLDNGTQNVEISGNTVANCSGAGIFASKKNCQVLNNTFYNNGVTGLVGQLYYDYFSSGDCRGMTISGNKFISKAANQPVYYHHTYSSNTENPNVTSSYDDNYYARPIDDNNVIRILYTAINYSVISDTYYSLKSWKTYTGQDVNSHKSPISITNENDLRFEYNETKAAKTISLAYPMIDVKGTIYSTSITLQPYTSVVLIKNPFVSPGAPTSVNAAAGDARASVTFAAPTNNGGSAITGYTVTSLPAGGTDINAGSTSLTHSITGLTNGTSYAFTVKATNSAGTSIVSVASNVVMPLAPVATTFTFSGPSGGNVNSASVNFTITPNNPYTGTITITQGGAGSTGLAARVLTYSNSAAAQTFTIVPTTADSITLTPTNSGAITNPVSLAYTANAVSPGVPTSVVASAGDAIESVTFAAPTNNGGSAIAGYTVTSIPSGGTDLNAGSTSLVHSITGLTNGTSYTFTVKAINAAGTSVASVASNAVMPLAPVATAFTLSGPSGGNVNSASANFTVTPNNSYTGTITITPTGTGSTGLVARVLNYSNSAAAQTFTILPITAGSITLTPTNSGAITNPVSLAYTANAVSPGVPTSVIATAGDAIASVIFATPTNNGGSVITGYTVTSIPEGGTDINAGSTSLIHSITGLANGTSYTFTVKATNSAGTSIASSVSNAVIPIDVTLPVISAFTIPSTSNSRTVSISRFTATDNNGISGYLLTETAAIPSTATSGWTSAAPSTYIFSSDGFKALYAWAKDAAGNISVLRYEAVIINSNLTVEPDAHFKTVWQGENGQNHMNMNVVSATLEGLQLSVADEIALFSGADCVGTIKLKESINSSDQSTFLTIHASQNDGSNNGFADNDTIIFKIWDSKNQLEILVNSVTYKNDIASWITSGKYVPGATSTVKIEAYTGISQTIVLKKGYNLISTYLNANYPKVTSVTKSLYDQGNLVKIQDEAGNSFENWGTYGGWINKIGSLENTEGYKIQVANNCTLQVIGKPVTLPMDIPLKTGWTIISFPYNDLVNAKSVIQSLIDQNRLSRVQDEEGNSIENWGQFGGWINGIGNFVPGKGYKVKVVANAILTLQQSYLKSATIIAKSEKSVHFTTNIEGNGSDHMNINIVGLRASGISVGDELAAYDGKICVGVIKINDDQFNTESASLVASFSSSEQAGDGFTEGHPIDIIAWNRITNSEKVVQCEVVNGKLSYLKNSSVLVKLKTQSIDVKSLEDTVQIVLYPNPSTGIVTVRFSEMPFTESRIDIVHISGRMILSRQITNRSEVFNLENQTSGIYLIKIKTGLSQVVHKLVLTK